MGIGRRGLGLKVRRFRKDDFGFRAACLLSHRQLSGFKRGDYAFLAGGKLGGIEYRESNDRQNHFPKNQEHDPLPSAGFAVVTRQPFSGGLWYVCVHNWV